MATPIRRATSIVEALVDGELTKGQLQTIGDAYAFTYRRGETLTDSQKASVFLNAVRSHVKSVVRDAIRSQVAAAAADAADADVDVGSDV